MPTRADHQPFLGFRKELAYGLRGDDLVPIDQAAKGAACGCVCPVCMTPLIARKGEQLVHHFAHAGLGQGCGVGVETNAHLWAKDALGQALLIRLPPVEAEAAGLSERVHDGGEFRFRSAELERHAGDIVPDVILTAENGRQLIVEVYVTHKCDSVKIDRIRAGGVSAIEVDLRRWRRSDDGAGIAEALLRLAPRRWLYNPAIDRSRAGLEDKARRLAEEAAKRRLNEARDEVARIRRAPVRKAPELETLRDALASIGYGGVLTGTQSGDGFVVPARLWKAAALGRLIRDMPSVGRGPQVTAEHLLGLIPDCLYRGPRWTRPRIDLKSLKAAAPGYQTVSEQLEAFIETLHAAQVLFYHKGDLWLSSEVVAKTRAEIAKRKAEQAARDAKAKREGDARARLGRLFESAGQLEESADFSLAAWSRNLSCAPGRSVEDLTSSGDAAWDDFVTRLTAVQAMLDGGAPVDDLLGLPFETELERARQQAKDIAAAERAAAEEAESLARSDRKTLIEDEAVSALGDDAAAFLSQPTVDGRDWLAEAERSADGLERARRAVARRKSEILAARLRAEEIEDLQSRLRKAASNVYDEAHATLFLKSARPELGLKSPLDICVDAYGLERCLHLLPTGRSRR